MTTYIRITRYSSGDSLTKQINDIIKAGKMDKDTRLFFDRNGYLTMRDLAGIWVYFEVYMDMEFAMDNLVLRPNNILLGLVKEGRGIDER